MSSGGIIRGTEGHACSLKEETLETLREKKLCYWRFGKPISTQQQNSRFVVRRKEEEVRTERGRGENLKHVRQTAPFVFSVQ